MLHLWNHFETGAPLITHDSLSESLAVMQHQEARAEFIGDGDLSKHPASCAKPCIAPPAIDYSKWSRMLEIWNGIGPNAREAWMMIGERLLMGRKQYNDDFDADSTKDAAIRELLRSQVSLQGMIDVLRQR